MTLSAAQVEKLRKLVDGRVVGADDPDWDAERSAWHLLVDQRPATIVHVTDADDIAATIRFAREHEYAVAAQPGGHGATDAINGTILLRTGDLTSIDVDLAEGVVRVGAGVRWRDLNAALTGTGLSSLPGSNGDTTVVGYALGGGLSWFGRKYGQAANTVRAFELVNADGYQQRVTREADPELFWALRGGGGEFGIIVSAELELVLAPQIYGGRMVWPVEHARDVLRAFTEITANAPDELTLWAWLLNLPDLPFVPEPLRGKWVTAVDAVYLGNEEEAEKLLTPLRAIAEPLDDGLASVPLSAVGTIAQEPDDPTPGLLKSVLLNSFDEEALDALLEVTAPGSASPLFLFEIRHLSGAFARADEGHGAAGSFEEPYLLLFGGIVPVPELAGAVAAAIEGVKAKLAPWISGRTLLNFASGEPLADIFAPEVRDRLRAVKQRVDPQAVIRGNHPIV
ncbi:FAD-binding oxidoreductase [Streptomyces sp. SID13031]|uniref:FAD-binding oxidoreductase n=1 Tax=Streptomyces sp. SID13031 TaxID=2706046 RepID=UPI0013C7C10B|nr:FAD-binding oxidoreductase [Streptomyces sp. SID13031]NEA31370.1 FAD-binding oxidoreductase [Streptomyces sp. SID13031]